jgi:hypothetical protein
VTAPDAQRRAETRDVCGIAALAAAGLVSIAITFVEWGEFDITFEPHDRPMTGWQAFVEVGWMIDYETANGRYSAFTGWATLLIGVVLIGVALLLASTVDRTRYPKFELPYPRWVVRTARTIGWLTITFMALTGILLVFGYFVGLLLLLVAGFVFVVIHFLALPPGDLI